MAVYPRLLTILVQYQFPQGSIMHYQVNQRIIQRRHGSLAAVAGGAIIVLLIAAEKSQGQIALDFGSAVVNAYWGGAIRLTDGSARFFNVSGFSEDSQDLSTPFFVDFSDTESLSRNGVTFASTLSVQQDTTLTVAEQNLTVDASVLTGVQTMISGNEEALVSATGGGGAQSTLQMGVQLDSPAEVLINGMMSIERTPPGPYDPDVGENYIVAVFVFGSSSSSNHRWAVVLDQTGGQLMAPINISGRLPAGQYTLEAHSAANSDSTPPLEDAKSMLSFSMSLTLVPAEFHWINADGGDFGTARNWSDGVAPGASDTAEFNLAGVYTVRLTENTTNAFMLVSGASAAEVANPRLQLIGNTYQAQQIAVQPHGELVIDGFSGLVKVDQLYVAAGGRLRGMAGVQPATAGGATNVIVEGDITMGDSVLSPQRRPFNNTDGGPEPAQFFAHFAVRGNYTQDAAGTMHVVLTAEKAVNESALAIGLLPPPPRSAELFVTGDANLAGKLQATTSPGYVPQHGDKFVVIDSMAPINSAFTEYEVPNAFNGLPLKPVKTGSDLQLVTPQKVVLAWGHDAPFGLNRVHLFGTDLSISDPSGMTPALRVPAAQQPMFEAFQEALQAHVEQQFTDSGIQSIVIESGAPDPSAITVYFVPEDPATSLLGRAISGIDRFNQHAGAEVVALIQNFNPAGPHNVELDAETIAHEVGHVIGLRHIDPPGAISVMDYDTADGDVELFQNGVFKIKEPPEAGGTEFADTHNPQYHLKRYVDGISHDELVSQGINPGTWDLPENLFPPLLAEFSFFASDVTLYDASIVYTESAPDEARLLAHFDAITLEALAAMSFEIQQGNGIGLLAASTEGGSHDVALMAGEPNESQELMLYPALGVNNLFLQRELIEGFETLSAVTLTMAVIPEMLPGDFNGDGSVDAADYVVWRKSDGTQDGYIAWRANFGVTSGSGSVGDSLANAAVPEPASAVLLVAVAIAACHCMHWRSTAAMQL
jgi:hypothetical protein